MLLFILLHLLIITTHAIIHHPS